MMCVLCVMCVMCAGIPEAVKALRREQQLYRMKKEAQLAKGEGREEQVVI